MNSKLRSHADTIVKEAVAAVLPDEAVRRALRERPLAGSVYQSGMADGARGGRLP